ncbi:C40 family peptidase [Aureimonas frigidaquae]|uniref:C40 family peptidase n=1 Tax=Aureimonas frigidaquae TaxID=424757 RepID=UPI00078173D4|nr:NlpC/P60 family protein [Aureimonas frigidaquae]
MSLDLRLNAARPDLADLRLQSRVGADRFVAGTPARIRAPLAALRRRPASDAPLETEGLCGEAVLIFEDPGEGWAWVQLVQDGYVGWMAREEIGPDAPAPDRIVTVPRTLVFPAPDIKQPPIGFLPMGAAFRAAGTAQDRNAAYVLIEPFGAVVMQHTASVDAQAADFVTVAEALLNVPYLWGGKSALGIDCSGLVQLAAGMAGHALLRDADMQEASAGVALDEGAPLQRGDLVFWPGHVGIMQDDARLIHANAHHMMVASEPLAAAVERAGAKGVRVTSRRRLTIA